MVWNGTRESLINFGQLINIHTTIKFEMTFDKFKAHFLDVEIRRIGTILQTDIYRRPTDANSFHPYNLKRKLPW